MKKFNFKFESILNIRSHKVNLAKEDLAKVLKEKNKRYDIITDYEEEISTLLQYNLKDIAYLQARTYRILHIEDQIKKLVTEIKNIEEIEKVRKEKLAELLKEEKIMEKLKENDFNQYKFDINKKDNEFIDEIANQRSIRR